MTRKMDETKKIYDFSGETLAYIKLRD